MDYVELKNELIKEIKKHKTPAPATINFMTETNNKFSDLKMSIRDIQNDIKNINSSLEDNNIQHREIINSMDSVNKSLSSICEKLDKKYAGKWVERTFVALGGAVGLSILYAILDLILKD